MNFKQFKEKLQQHVADMLNGQNALFLAGIDRDELWNLYLNSFPPGTNEIFRERREFDCSCCRQFIKSFGGVVVVDGVKKRNIWDFDLDDPTYGPVIKALSEYVKLKPIRDIFVAKEAAFGTDHNFEQREDGSVHCWEHFRINLPKRFVTRSSETVGTVRGLARDIKNVLKRSLEEISGEAIDTVLELIAQKSLYKGDEWRGVLNQFLDLHTEYHELSDHLKENFCWIKSTEVGGAVGKIRNHSIGVLLTEISDGIDLNDAVKRYENIVAPTNYKRPKAIFTKKMVEQAEVKIANLGLIDSLGRRHAIIDDITVNNILFANKDVSQKISDVFDELKQDASINPRKFDKIEKISAERFVSDVLPSTTKIEMLFENKHTPNLVSLIAPKIADANGLFKWDNGFSWAYNGNITDSMKERVKSAGGNVEGVLRFSIQWNEDGDNQNDFDAHCREPNRNLIYYQNKRVRHQSSGMLDVDILEPRSKVAVENIVWTNGQKMPEGVYHLYVHVYSYRGGNSGFRAEIEFDGQVYSYDYTGQVGSDDKITVAKVEYSKQNGFKIIESMKSSMSSREVWGLKTNQFHPVSVFMYSPNYWDDQTGIGHMHYMFMVDGCKNDDRPNGFFNEFLKEGLMEHKRVFEALGSKVRVKQSDNQLSGVGFSSTKRDSLVLRVEGHTKRIMKITF